MNDVRKADGWMGGEGGRMYRDNEGDEENEWKNDVKR